MPQLRSIRTCVTALTLAGVLIGCGGSASEPRTVSHSEAYVALIRWEIDQRGGSQGSEVPVIHVTSALGDSIDPGTQAEVADAVRGEADVRFADRREDVIDSDDDDEPVKDGGVMLLVGPLPEPARAVQVDVVRYTSLADQTSYVATVSGGVDSASVTAVSVVPR